MSSAVPLSPVQQPDGAIRHLQRAVAFGIGYLVCAWAGNLLSVREHTYVSFWLPSGLYVAALLLTERRAWPQLMLAAFIANLIFDWSLGTRLAMIPLFYCSNTAQALLGAWLVQRFVAKRPTLSTLGELAGLVAFAGLLSTVVGATLGAATLTGFGLSDSFVESWKVWWGSCAMAVLLVAPLALSWNAEPNSETTAGERSRRWFEAGVLACGMVLLAWYTLVQGPGINAPHKSRFIPLLLWAGLRFGTRGAAAANLLLALLVAFFTTQFQRGLTPADLASGGYVFTLQTFLAIVSMVSLVPAIVLGERDRMVAQLRDSEERFRNLTAAAFEGICISERGAILDVNDQLLKMLGYERDEMIGKHVSQFVSEESRAIVEQAVREGRESNYEHRLLRKDGGILLGEAQAKIVRQGGQQLRMTAIRDISERKRAEEERETSETLLRQFIKHAPAAIAMLDTELRYLQTSDRWLTDYHLEGRDIIGKSHYEVFPDIPQRWKDIHQRVLAGAVERCDEDPFPRADGTMEWLQWEVRPWHKAGSAIGGAIFFTQVITARKNLEMQLSQSQKMEAIGTLAGGIAHDFNNILSGIIAYTEDSRLEHPNDQRLQENLGEVLSASHRAASLVQQVLTFSRQRPQERVSVHVEPLVREALKLLRSTLPSTIQFEPSYASDLPPVMADPTQIHQIVVNLCTNAGHAMRGTQGCLSVRLQACHVSPSAPAPAPELRPGDYLRLTVRDTGHGMSETVAQRIFEPFFTTKGPGEGTGLGLSVVHGIVKDHGGVITVESEPGRGTTFQVFLPAIVNEVVQTPRPPVNAARGNGERVLFVDDEIVLCQATRKLLTRLGFRPTVLNSANEAWDAFSAAPNDYDVVITDLTMPHMTGIELAKKMLQTRPSLPIILTSGYSNQLTTEAVQELGIRELILKPLDHVALLGGIQRALDPGTAASRS